MKSAQVRRLVLVTCVLLIVPAALFAAIASFSGKVVSVVDGDTIGIMRDGKEVRVRLDGIDCPELGQDFGTKAKQFVSSMVFGKEVTADIVDVDKYGRLVCRVEVDGKDVSLELVKAGLAWHYKQYSNEKALAEAEVAARHDNSGLWSMANPVAPWEFRHGVNSPSNSGAAAAATAQAPSSGASDDENITVYVTKTGHKYHAAGCRYLARSQIPISLAEAKARGYSPCSVCGGGVSATEPPSQVGTKSGISPASSDAASSNPTVYITRTGSKYHAAGCRYLSKSCIPISLNDAISQGYTPCSVCGGGVSKVKKESNKSDSYYDSDRVKVKGYYRKDGTYVRPHTRRKPKTK
jgi:micrococcal nuclease